MRDKSKIKKIIMGLAVLTCFLSSVTLVHTWIKVGASPVISQSYEPQDLSYGASFTLPQRSYELNGETVTAKTTITSPSGLTYDTEILTLNEVGVWIVRFDAEFDKLYTDTYRFEVYQPQFMFTGPNGEINYGRVESFPDYDTLQVKIPNGSSFECNEVIDLSKLTAQDELISLGFNVATKGSQEVSRLTICLTDVYDENNQVFIDVLDNGGNDAATVVSSFTDSEVEMGFESYSDGKYKAFVSNGKYGSYAPMFFRGDGDVSNADYNGGLLRLSYDYEGKEVHALNKIWYGSPIDPRYKTMVADLDKTDYSDCNLYDSVYQKLTGGFEVPFKGFTTGEVRLSISASGYIGNSCGIAIRSIYGVDLTKQKSYDTTKPQIMVDTDEYTQEDMPTAEVGKAYEVFKAMAQDNQQKNVALYTSVYYILGSVRAYNVSISNGSFLPDKEGIYEIVYVADDGAGNIAEKRIYVEAINDVRNPEIILEGEDSSAICGTPITLADCEIISYSGKTTQNVTVQLGTNELDIENNSFVPKEEGTYVVTYEVMDYIGQKTSKTYEIIVTADDKPILPEEPFLPNAFIAGSDYLLPMAYAYDYRNNGAQVIPKIYAVENGNRTELINGRYVATATSSGEITIEYVYSGSNGILTKAYILPVLSIADLTNDQVKYFLGNNVKVEQEKKAVKLSFNNNAQVDFAKAIPTNDTELLFAVYKDGDTVFNNAEKINVYFRDTVIKSRVVKITIYKGNSENTTSYIAINDGKKQTITGNFFGFETDFRFNILSQKGVLRVGSVEYAIEKYLNGESFVGFTNVRAYVSFAIEGYNANISTNFSLLIKRIGSASFGKTTGDFIGPDIYIDGTVKSSYREGDVIKTLVAYATDMLQENVTTTYSVDYAKDAISGFQPVKSKNGEFLTNVPADKSYEFILSSYGSYRVTYTSIDALGNESTVEVVYYVPADVIEPTITLSMGDFKCKVNKEITLPTATVKDNFSSTEALRCTLIYYTPDGKMVTLGYYEGIEKIDCKYIFTELGEGQLIWVAYDEHDNITFKTIRVVVEE